VAEDAPRPRGRGKWTEIRRETGLVEYVCEHGVGHPAVGSALWQAETRREDEEAWMIHGCDGCCARDDFPGTAIESLKRAHQIIRDLKRRFRECRSS